MSEIKMPQRWDFAGDYTDYLVPLEEGDYVKVEDVKPLVDEITRLRARVGELTDALIDARFNGLIYWSPMTERGAVERAKMMARIDSVIIKEAKP